MRRWLPALLLAMFATIAFQRCSLGVTSALLEQQADREALAYAGGSGPFDWRFATAHDLTFSPPGLNQVAYGPDGMSGIADSPDVLLPLRLSGRRIDTGYADSLLLDIESDRALRWQLLLGSEVGSAPYTSSMQLLPAGRSRLRFDARSLPLQPQRWQDQPIGFLQIRLQMETGQRLSLRQFSLMPGSCRLGPQSTRLRCPLPATAQLDRASRPEQMLQQADALRRTSPQALLPAPAIVHATVPAALGTLPTPFWLLLALLLLAYAAVRRSGRWRPRPRLELAAFVGLPVLLLAAGWPMPQTPPLLHVTWAIWFSAALLLPEPASTLSGTRLPWRWLGGWTEAGRMVLATLALLALLLIAASATASASSGVVNLPAPGDIVSYLGWALLQQLFLLRFVVPRLGHVHRSSILQATLGGVLFGVLHLPNLALMLLTALAGSVWIGLSLRSRSLLPLALSHALLGAAALALLPAWVLRSAEIGGRFVFM